MQLVENQSPIKSCQSQIPNQELPESNPQSRVARIKSPIKSCQSQIPNQEVPETLDWGFDSGNS
jgi:hypothetical protein